MDVIVEMTFVEALAATDDIAVFGRDLGIERERTIMLDVRERHEHAVDQTEIVPVLQADDFLAVSGSSRCAQTRASSLALFPRGCSND